MSIQIGTRLRALREARGYSQEQLTRLLDFNDRQTLSTIENGTRKVTAEELLKAMNIFGVSMDHFTDPFLLAGEGRFSWRQTGVEPAMLRTYEEAAGRVIAAFKVLGSELGQRPRALRATLNLSTRSKFEDAAEAAERLADELQLGEIPAHSLAEVMSDRLGILVLMVDPIEGVSGAACRLPELDVVLINRNEVAGRRHFDLAHELFHVLTWEKMPPEHIEETTPTGKRSRVEQLADSFASALLMPLSVLDRYGTFKDIVGQGLCDKLNLVADDLLVSSQALRWRLLSIGRLSRAQSDAILDEALRFNGHAKPEKQNLPPLLSRPFVEIVAKALDEGKISMRRMSSILGVAIDDFEELFRAHRVDGPYEL